MMAQFTKVRAGFYTAEHDGHQIQLELVPETAYGERDVWLAFVDWDQFDNPLQTRKEAYEYAVRQIDLGTR
jgi:hypothetical protein